MFARDTPSDMKSDKSCRRNGARDLASILLLILLTTTAVACQSSLAASTEQWIPSYLQLRLSAGKAQVQWPGDSEWKPLEDGATVAIEETGRIIADTVEGARFSVGNSSTLELDPGTTLELQNPRISPRLQMALMDGALLFTARAPSYELLVSAGSVSFLGIPSQIEVEVDGETTRLAVIEGAVVWTMEEELITLSACQQAEISAGGEPEITEFCLAGTATPGALSTIGPSPTVSSLEPTATSPSPTAAPPSSPTATPTSTRVSTPTATSTPSPTPTPTSAVLTFVPTYTPVPPTSTPPPPPTKEPRRDPTNTPQPPPTNPPPTREPPPPPTEPPPPPPTEPSRPTATPLRPTAAPSS
jgi:hypothetical protein